MPKKRNTVKAADKAKPAGIRVVLTDYWDNSHRPYRSVLHDPVTDERLSPSEIIGLLATKAGAADGDEIAVSVTRTGKRPFGGRKVRLVRPNTYERDRERKAANPAAAAGMGSDKPQDWKHIDRVTITGADDTVEPGHLFELWKAYPFVEFGILLSRNNTKLGCARFPSRGWLYELALLAQKALGLPLAGHLCGQWVKELLSGLPLDGFGIVMDTKIGSHISRWQLNTHGVPHDFAKDAFLGAVMGDPFRERQIVFQLDGQNDGLASACKDRINVAVLHDRSSGKGLVPAEWPGPVSDVYNGYAGGLGPENAAIEIEKICAKLADLRLVWIDAETSLRSQDSTGRSIFDLSRAASFLKAAEPFVNRNLLRA
jgi:hypothetical protein